MHGGSRLSSEIRVFIVEDQDDIRRALEMFLAGHPGIAVTGTASTAAEALASVGDAAPDVCVLDIRLPDGNGVELCRELRSTLPGVRCVMLTAYSDDATVVDAVLAGADAYVLKGSDLHELAVIVTKVAAGRSMIDSSVTRGVLGKVRNAVLNRNPPDELQPYEEKIIELIGGGLTNRQISQALFLSEDAVRQYVTRLLDHVEMRRASGY